MWPGLTDRSAFETAALRAIATPPRSTSYSVSRASERAEAHDRATSDGETARATTDIGEDGADAANHDHAGDCP